MNTIFFDLDGCLAGLYDVPNWLDMLIAEDPTPYAVAKPLVNMSRLARYLNKLQRNGYQIGIISWLSKESTIAYDELVKQAKLNWLKAHMPSVHWNVIYIVPYGMNKWETCGKTGILFDDEARNRDSWENGYSFLPEQIFDILTKLTRTV